MVEKEAGHIEHSIEVKEIEAGEHCFVFISDF